MTCELLANGQCEPPAVIYETSSLSYLGLEGSVHVFLNLLAIIIRNISYCFRLSLQKQVM